MTEAQKEYIITEEEMAGIEMYPYDPVTRMVAFKAVRSRPYKSDAVLEVGIDYILQKLELEYDDNGYNPNIPLWIQVRDDLRTIRQQKEREQG